MSNYIIKKVTIRKAKVNYQEADGYEFAPKGKKYDDVAKVTVLEKSLKEQILKKKIENDYRKIVMHISTILNEDPDDSGSVLTAYTELDRLKQILIYKYKEKLNKKILEMYLKKLSILEMEINKLMINILNFEEQNKGVKR